MRHFLPILLLPLLTACTTEFDEADFPEDQKATELAFRRMADHGQIEPVIEPDQSFKDWHFRITSYKASVSTDDGKSVLFTLVDASGIQYLADERTPQAVRDEMNIGDYGFATGKVVNVERDLVEGQIIAVLVLSEWRDK